MSRTPQRATQMTRCPGCGFEWATRANGYSVTCVRCDHAHYVPRQVDQADTLATRPRREVTCRCGCLFSTRARIQSATKCPECRASVWVPLAAPVAPPEFPRRSSRESDPVWWDDDDDQADDDQADDDQAPTVTPGPGAFSRFLADLLARPTPAAPARPAPAPAPVVARPAAAPRCSPAPDRPGGRVRLYGMPVWPVATRRADRCSLVSAHRDEQCRGGADVVADVAGREFVLCEGHGHAVQRAHALRQVPPLA
jgi:hypothetical protein